MKVEITSDTKNWTTVGDYAQAKSWATTEFQTTSVKQIRFRSIKGNTVNPYLHIVKVFVFNNFALP